MTDPQHQTRPRYDPSDPETTLTRLIDEEAELDFDDFNADDAWAVGCALRELALTHGATIAVAIDLAGRRVVQTATRGTAPLHDAWLERKLRTVAHYGNSTLAVRYRHIVADEDFERASALDRTLYTVGGGGFPLRVRGELIGAIAVSGLEMHEDNQWAVDALWEHRLNRSDASATSRGVLPDEY